MKVYMFHYVMDNFNYFHFDAYEFEKIVHEITKKYKVIGLKEAKDIIENKKESENTVILTFDDGTKDHYRFVYPILKKYNVKGVFFITSNIFENTILDIHKIHMLLSTASAKKLVMDIRAELKVMNYNFKTEDFILTNYDDDNMRYVKQLLQFVLPEEIRKNIIDKLLNKYNIKINFDDYYINYNNIMEMKQSGMEFGIHTKSHKRLEFLTKEEQRQEIIQNINVLEKNNILEEIKAIAYPFGSYNKETIEIIHESNIDLGFSIDKTIGCDSSLEIKRIDAKELIK